jgi:hypothetical protein
MSRREGVWWSVAPLALVVMVLAVMTFLINRGVR